MNVIFVKDYDEMSEKAAEEISKVLTSKKDAILGLATGSTPVGMYEKLAEKYKKGELDFSQVKSVNLDEYVGLPEDHDQSYRYFMNYNLFDKVNIDKKNTHVPNGNAPDMEKEAKDYENLIDSLGGADIQVLGIGGNGHVGFNEPDDELNLFTSVVKLREETIKDNSRFFKSIHDVPKHAISMGMASILKSKKILLLASGKNKAKVIGELLNKNCVTTKNPSTFVRLHSDVTIIIDEEAAKHVKR
ncbi:MAG: glucosamine-6-phosphate deaminase [Oscillospiraceae bacterium]|nr:glucosamine-6-phosphate deaminase [Oscillospiraceae bacterium]